MSRTVWVAVGCLWAFSAPAEAHPLAPAALMLEVRDDGLLETRYRTSAAADARVELELPEGCRVVREDPQERDGRTVVRSSALRCDGNLQGRAFTLRGLSAAGIDGLVRLRFADGRSVQALLGRGHERFVIPARARRGEVFRQYVWLGMEHLWTGLDHVLFLLTLLVVVRERRRAVLALTAFTLGHSVTLCLAALDILRLPQRPVEVGIAASLVWMAAAAVGRTSARSGAAWVAAAFGLLHGLGFAGVLREAGLAAAEVPWSLFAFNVGIELAQLLLAVLAWGAAAVARRVHPEPAPALTLSVLYGVGALSAFWVLERALL